MVSVRVCLAERHKKNSRAYVYIIYTQKVLPNQHSGISYLVLNRKAWFSRKMCKIAQFYLAEQQKECHHVVGTDIHT